MSKSIKSKRVFHENGKTWTTIRNIAASCLVRWANGDVVSETTLKNYARKVGDQFQPRISGTQVLFCSQSMIEYFSKIDKEKAILEGSMKGLAAQSRNANKNLEPEIRECLETMQKIIEVQDRALAALLGKVDGILSLIMIGNEQILKTWCTDQEEYKKLSSLNAGVATKAINSPFCKNASESGAGK